MTIEFGALVVIGFLLCGVIERLGEIARRLRLILEEIQRTSKEDTEAL
jgi:Sec-independent protein translocase protein TatA